MLGLLGLVVVGGQLWGLQGWSAPKLYDPDPQACQVEMIRTTYRSNLLPWQDQPEVVQQRLRQLQAAMTLDTLRDCQSKGLLTPAQVSGLTLELKLTGELRRRLNRLCGRRWLAAGRSARPTADRHN